MKVKFKCILILLVSFNIYISCFSQKRKEGEYFREANIALKAHQNLIDNINGVKKSDLNTYFVRSIAADKDFLSRNSKELPLELLRLQNYLKTNRKSWEEFIPKWKVEYNTKIIYFEEIKGFNNEEIIGLSESNFQWRNGMSAAIINDEAKFQQSKYEYYKVYAQINNSVEIVTNGELALDSYKRNTQEK